MVIGTAGNGHALGTNDALKNLTVETQRMLDAEQALTAVVEEVLLRRRGEWPKA
jgi:hypothetical protein